MAAAADAKEGEEEPEEREEGARAARRAGASGSCSLAGGRVARPPPASRSPPLPGPPRPGRTESRHTAARGGSPRQPSWDGGPQAPLGTPEATCVLEANFCLPR